MSLTTINSGGVKDDSIVNADIKSDAAIALSKLASTPAVLTGSTNNTIVTVTGANAITGEASLTYNGMDTLSIDHSATDENSYIKIAADDNRRKTLVFDSGGTTRGVIGIGDSDEASATSLFLSANSNVAGDSPHLVIDSSGNVLVGTTDTTLYNNTQSSGTGIMLRGGHAIDIARSGDLQLTLNRLTNEGASIALYQAGDLKGTIGTKSGGIYFGTDGDTERMRIDSDGRVLIGTTTAAHWDNRKLSIANSTDTYLEVRGGSSHTCGILFTDGTGSGTEAYTGYIVYSHATNAMAFHTNSGGERLRITSGGNIGFNRTNVDAGDNATQTSTATPNRFVFNNDYSSGYTDASLKVYLFNDGGTRHGFTSGPAYDLQYHSSGHATNAKHTFFTENSERLRIASGGIEVTGGLLVKRDDDEKAGTIYFAGSDDSNHMLWNDYWNNPSTTRTTTDNFDGMKWNTYMGLQLFGKGNEAETIARFMADGACELYYNNSKKFFTEDSGASVCGDGNDCHFRLRDNSDNVRGVQHADSNGTHGFVNMAATSWTFYVGNTGDYYFAGSAVSDRDRKDNITTVTGTSLDKITKLVPKTYNWKNLDGITSTDRTFTGFIAQEVKEHLPSLVNGTDGQKDMSVDYTGILAHAVKAIQELSAEVEALKAK